MKKTIVILAILGTLAGCRGGRQTHAIADAAKAETIMLQKGKSQGHIHSLSVVCRGYLDGTAELVLMLNGKPCKSEKLSGDVDFQWRNDWYSNSARIEYKPTSVKSGSLSIQYEFKDS